ncbi:MAG: hypothetical protein AAFW75_26880 [Cyanobacteria bacterium J06636_16]
MKAKVLAIQFRRKIMQAVKTQKQMSFDSLIDDYFQTLNELDETRRIDTIQKVWAVDGIFVSPVGRAQSHQENSDLITAFHQNSPGITIRRAEEIEILHTDYLRFGFEAIRSDGRSTLAELISLSSMMVSFNSLRVFSMLYRTAQ